MAARVGAPVLITALSRDRREACARFIHASGPKARGPFVVYVCAVDGSLADGATLRKQFDHARGGTLFVDDIATLTHGAQVELCDLVGEYQPRRASTNDAKGLNVRLIAGASRHLDAEREGGAFCERLFYRLNVVHIDLVSS